MTAHREGWTFEFSEGDQDPTSQHPEAIVQMVKTLHDNARSAFNAARAAQHSLERGIIVGHLSGIDSHTLAALTGLPLEAVNKTIQSSTESNSAAT
ncbi:hypothetical protein [Rathayibacter iranicus]|uniref:hypothetical protein n=1 Tax=Rathayibacter iranicus TaxID=59737 RepID=UPI000FD7D0B6|nr:hypothetical protein [Rathayibacter iranicus]MWV29976.1 hypothetical protein [Rathayibacter iranicus NCPPB 2253 = VKM Ac-1602]